MKVKYGQDGFTLIEVMMAIMIFSLGVFALASMQMTSMQGNDRANIGSEATTIAGDKLEELMALTYFAQPLVDTDLDGTAQDTAPDDGIDDDGGNFGLADLGANADFFEVPPGTQGNYTVFWNVAVDEPVVNSKLITILVQWTGQDGQVRQVVLTTVKGQFGG